MPKKKWERPKLIVLVRRPVEETVLEACKSTKDVGPGVEVMYCSVGWPTCTDCYSRSSS